MALERRLLVLPLGINTRLVKELIVVSLDDGVCNQKAHSLHTSTHKCVRVEHCVNDNAYETSVLNGNAIVIGCMSYRAGKCTGKLETTIHNKVV